MNDRDKELRRLLGSKPPKTITQEAPLGNNKHFRKLMRQDPNELPDVSLLWWYAHDTLYGPPAQKELFLWVLPFMLRAWRMDLRGESWDWGGFVEYFYPLMAKEELAAMLNHKRTKAVAEYMRQAILEEIDVQCGLEYEGKLAIPYRWIASMNSCGVILDDLESLWSAWWSLGTHGRAAAAIQYISCLAFDENDNPIFLPWTPDGGGGPPSLWEFEGILYDRVWKPANVEMLKDFLQPDRVMETLERAVAALAEKPEGPKAQEVLAGVIERREILENRCEDLPRILATNPDQGEWTV